MSKHTPGPWTAVQDGNKVDWYIVDEDESVIVFGLSEPDARLSAAAPDLLAALREIDTIVNESASECRKRMGTRLGNIMVTARAAIAKAEGVS